MLALNGYLDGSTVVVLYRDNAGAIRRTAKTAEYVVYVRVADVPQDMQRSLARSQYVRSYKVEGDWVRIGWTDGYVRENMCSGKRGGPNSPFSELGISTFEGDVPPLRRLLADAGATIQRPRRCYIDIETDSRVPFSKKEEMRVLSWVITDDEENIFTGLLEADTGMAERDLLYAFWKALEPYDQVLAWNGENFDYPVLFARTDARGVRVDTRRWLFLDHLELYKKLNVASESGDEKASMKLDSVATNVLGEGKDDFDASKTWEAWEAGGESRERMLRYMIKDGLLLPRIEKRTGFIDLFQAICEACRIFPETRSLQSTVQMDGYMLRLGLERGVHFATKKYNEGAAEKFRGAYVMEPKFKGITRDVHVADFAALYPSIILTWNMSPETKRAVPQNGPIPTGMNRSPGTGQGFDDGGEGILPTALRELIKMRKTWNEKKAQAPPGTTEWKDADRKSTAYKVVANSFYGVVGSPFSRYFDKNIGEAITQNGKWLIQRTQYEAEKRKMFVGYIDTDSLFVSGVSRTEFESFVCWCNEELYPELLKTVGCTRNEIKLAYEKQFERVVFVSAKRYAGKFLHYKGKEATADSKPEIKGLEFKRGDTARLARSLQEDVIGMLMDGQERSDIYREKVERTLDHVMNEPLPSEEVVVAKALSKPLKEYSTKVKKDGTAGAEPPHVQVARMMAKAGREVNEGTRIEYFVVDGDPMGTLVVRPGDEYGDVEADRYYLWDNLVYPPTMRLLEAAFPDMDWKRGLETVRPKKQRAAGKRVSVNQAGFVFIPKAISDLPEVKMVQRATLTGAYILEVPEELGEVFIHELLRICERHRGARPLEIHVHLVSGARAFLNTPQKVTGSVAMQEEVALARHLYWEAIQQWETALCGR